MSGQNRNRRNSAGNPSWNGDRPKKNPKSTKPWVPTVDPTDFWGDPDLLPEPITTIRSVPDVNAVVSSLGRVPIAGQETAAEHWFTMVYERGAVLANALAAAGGIEIEASPS